MKEAFALVALLAAAVSAQDDFELSVELFQFGKKAPMKQCPELELWHIQGDVYTKNGTGYFSDDCWSRDGRYISHNDSYKHAKILDFHKMESVLLPGASLPLWCRQENTAVFLTGSTLRMLKMDEFTKLTVISDSVGEGGRMGNVDCHDEYVYVWAAPDGVIRYPLREGGEVELCSVKGTKVDANPFHPVVNIKRADGKPPLGMGGIWMNLDGSEQQWMNPGMMRHHSNWLGNGEYFILGDGPVRGRKWNEPYPSNVHLLSLVESGDFGTLGASGRWTVAGGNGGRAAIRAADLRSGDLLFEFWPLSAVAFPAGSGDKSGYYDSEPKGSPDGTKFIFGTTCDLTEISHALAEKDQRGTTVEVTSTEGFPDSGYFAHSDPKVNGCAVAEYTSKTERSFQGVTGGAFGTARADLKKGAWITPWEPRLLPKEGFEPTRKSSSERYANDQRMAGTPLQYQRNLQSYIAIVRKPDAPWMRKTATRIELVPGENHRETRGYFIFRDGTKLNEEPVPPGGAFTASAPGIYSACAVEWFGLESTQGPSVTLSTPGEIRILKSKPDDFSWTANRWVVNGAVADEAAALAVSSAKRETVHRVDGVIATAEFRKGETKSLFDLNKDGKAIRRCFYEGGQMVKREYYTRDGKLDARELFDDEGLITEQMIHFHGGNTPDMHWYFEEGAPQRLVAQIFNARAARQGPGTYEKQGLDWVKVK